MICERCGTKLTGNQQRWCSLKCGKLGLKSEYRKRHAEKLKAYQREYRRAKNGGNRSHPRAHKVREDTCLNCGTHDDLQLAHVKPLWAGGTHKHVITLCRTCHHQFDTLLKSFWRGNNTK